MHDTAPHTLKRMLHGFQEQMDYVVDNMANEYEASEYVKWQAYYNLRIYNYLSKRQECREEANRFIISLRDQVLRFPQLEKLKKESFIVRVLCDYGVALPHRPFKLPWEDFMAENYVKTIQEWVDFIKRHPECANAAQKDLLRLCSEAESLCLRENYQLPRSLVRDVKKICRKNNNNLKIAIWTFITEIPLVKPLYRAAKRWRNI